MSLEDSHVTELDTIVAQGNVRSLCSGVDGTLGTSPSFLTAWCDPMSDLRIHP